MSSQIRAFHSENTNSDMPENWYQAVMIAEKYKHFFFFFLSFPFLFFFPPFLQAFLLKADFLGTDQISKAWRLSSNPPEAGHGRWVGLAWGFSQLLKVHEGALKGASASALMASLEQLC